MSEEHSAQLTEFEGRQATQPKPAEGARAGGPAAATQGTATGIATEQPAEGSDEVAPPNDGSPRG